MASANTTLNYDDFNIENQNYVDRSDIQDLVFTRSMTMDALKKMGCIKTGGVIPGKFEWRGTFQNPSGMRGVAPLEVIEANVTDMREPFILPVKTYATDPSLALSMEDVENNKKTPEKIADIVDELIRGAVEQSSANMNVDFYNTGANSLGIIGTRKAIAVDREYAGVNSTNYTWWDANIVNSSTFNTFTYADLINYGSAYHIDRLLSRVMLLASQKGLNAKNSFILCQPKFKEAVRLYVKEFFQIQSKSGTGTYDVGVDDVSYRGIPLFDDPDCPVDTTATTGISHNYLLPREGIEFKIGKTDGTSKGMFTFTGWTQQRPRQRSLIASLECRAMLIFKNPAKCFDIQCQGSSVGSESL